MKYFRFKNWSRHQHYHDRNPPWVKLYTSIIDPDSDWLKMTDAECGVLAKMLAWASRNNNAMPYNSDVISEEIGASSPVDLERLVASGMFEVFDSRLECVAEEQVRVSSLKDASKNASANASKSASGNASIRDQRSEFRDSEGKEEKNPPTPRKLGAPVGAVEVVEHLNRITGKSYAKDRATKEIEGALSRGATVAECCEVLDYCWREWRDNPKMVGHVDKTTPFRKANFDRYLDAARAGSVKAARSAPKPVEDDDPELTAAEREAARVALSNLGLGGMCNWT